MNKNWIIIGIVIAIILAIFFFPKTAGRGSCGFCGPGEFKWIEKNCIGIKHIPEIKNCADCPTTMKCYGIIYGDVKCYDKIDEPRQQIGCE